jgi:deoxyribodipyrimidine photolyase-related protein
MRSRWASPTRGGRTRTTSTRRFAATAQEADRALADFIQTRLNGFGPFEDAILTGDWTMAQSMLSAPLNLGLLDPLEVVRTVAAEHTEGLVPMASVEGFVRQVMGWRDYVWHLYWYLGETYRTTNNRLDATNPLPQAFRTLETQAVEATCLRETTGASSRTLVNGSFTHAETPTLAAAAAQRMDAAERSSPARLGLRTFG